MLLQEAVRLYTRCTATCQVGMSRGPLLCRWNLPGEPTHDWQALRESKNKELERLTNVYKKNLESANVDFIEGLGKVVDEHTVEVKGKRYSVSSCGLRQPALWPALNQGMAYQPIARQGQQECAGAKVLSSGRLEAEYIQN